MSNQSIIQTNQSKNQLTIKPNSYGVFLSN